MLHFIALERCDDKTSAVDCPGAGSIGCPLASAVVVATSSDECFQLGNKITLKPQRGIGSQEGHRVASL